MVPMCIGSGVVMVAVPALLVFRKFSVPSRISMWALPAVAAFSKVIVPPGLSTKVGAPAALLTMPVPEIVND